MFVPILIPNFETQILFNQCIQNIYTFSYDSWYIERNLSAKGNELQVGIDSAQHVNGPKNLIASFQTAERIAAPNKNNNITIFDNVNVRNCFCEIGGYRNPKDAVLTIFPEHDYLD